MIGPSLPQRSSDHGTEGSDGQQSGPSTSRRVMGPMLPDTNQRTESSEGISLAAKEFIDRQERIRLASEHDKSESGSASNSSKQPEQRPDWMLAPPSATGLSEMFNKDPSAALKSRGFNQSGNMRVQRTANVPTNPDDIDSVSWTETPQDRAKRLYEEQMGIRRVNGDETHMSSHQADQERQREERVRQAVQEHQASRGPSLLEQHQAKRRKDLRDKDHHRSDRDDRHRRHHSRRSKTSDDEESRSSRHRRHRRERSHSVSDDGENRSKTRDKHSESGRSSRHGEDRHGRRRESRQGDNHSSSRRTHRSRSRSKSPSKERDSERHRAEKREEKEKRREKERKKRRRDEEEKEEKRGAPTMIWDRETALSVGGQLMDERKRTDFIKSSATLSDRFGQGSSRYM